MTACVDAKTTSTAWTHIPAEKVTAPQGHNTTWHTAYVKTTGLHTTVDTEAKNEAHATRWQNERGASGRRGEIQHIPVS